MPIYLSNLAQGFDNLTCVTRSHTVQQALEIMLAKGYTQLPIIDSERRLIGVVSEHSILQTLYDERKTYDQFAKLAVIDCLDEDGHTILGPQDDIFAAMERLERTAYVVVVDANRAPMGIVTSYDTGQIFSAIGEVLVRARDIEERLREYIHRAFPTAEQVASALQNAFTDVDKKDVDRLTFGDLISIIVSGKNWPAFDKVLGPQYRFRHQMESARDIRNDIAHYRRQVDKQRDIPALKRCFDWLDARERLPLILATQARVVLAGNGRLSATGTVSPPTYAPHYAALAQWLQSLQSSEQYHGQSILVSFADIEKVLATALPQAAAEHLSWWANDLEQPQADGWLSAGWRVADVNMQGKLVTFTTVDAEQQRDEASASSASEE